MIKPQEVGASSMVLEVKPQEVGASPMVLVVKPQEGQMQAIYDVKG
ncbi:hypothetical protein [Paenibacillus zeisoli]|nr:hypothetical protein [Paenibacillus zeisoli]